MNFYSVLFIHLKLLSKSKIHILSQLVVKSKSFDFINFIKLIEVNRNENIRSYFINKDKTINWFIQSFSYDKLAVKTNLFNWIQLLRIIQLKRKVFYNESSKIQKKKKLKPYLKKSNKFLKYNTLKKQLFLYIIYNVKFLILFL